ncbi:MAG TPA: hypothetical protein VGA99_15605 [bacterium]
MKKTKKVVYHVQCAFDPKHVFEKVIEIVEGTENKQSQVEAYCPLCDKFVTVTVQGETPTTKTLRKFDGS